MELDPPLLLPLPNTERGTAGKGKKCHGNRKLRRFRRKCRRRGLDDEQIHRLILARPAPPKENRMKRKSSQRSQGEAIEATTVRSISQLSLSQQQQRRLKRKRTGGDNRSINGTDLYRPSRSRYLSMPKKLLFRSICRQVNHPLKQKKQRTFVINRLAMLDEHFCLGMCQHLYRSYLEIGSSTKQWPVSEDRSLPIVIFFPLSFKGRSHRIVWYDRF